MVGPRRVRTHLHFVVVDSSILTRRTTVLTILAMDSVRVSFGRRRGGGGRRRSGGGGGSSDGFIIGRRQNSSGGVQRQRRITFGARYSRLRTGHCTAGIPRITGTIYHHRSSPTTTTSSTMRGRIAGVGQDFMGVFVVFLTKCSQRDFARHGQGGRGKTNGVFLRVCLYVCVICVYVCICVCFFSPGLWISVCLTLAGYSLTWWSFKGQTASSSSTTTTKYSVSVSHWL